MLCTFCGTENRPEFKFCGTCGVRLERRQVERRTHQGGVSTKCTGCGYVNEPGLKFCGMCGTRIERRMQERRGTGDAHAVAIANAQLPTPDVVDRRSAKTAAPAQVAEEVPIPLPRRGEPAIFRNEPAHGKPGNGTNISGPSFLGLNSQAEENDVEYLLDDQPTGSGLRKLVLLVILAAIAGLIFVQWRSSFKANPKNIPAKTEPGTPAPGPQGSNQSQTPAAANTPAQEAARVVAVGLKAVESAVSANESKEPGTEPAALEGEGASATSATKEPADKKSPTADDALPNADAKPADEARLPDYKPSAALVRAQQYIRGQGVQQNCEQGLLYLRAATEKSDPGAAIQMAALYSSGLCVKQDRVMAYRWFNSAHELQPANMWIQKNMDQLWAQMSSQERRLAGY
jgi:hypothetical protein